MRTSLIKYHYFASIMAFAVMVLADLQAQPPRSPIDLSLSKDQKSLYVAELTGSSIAIIDTKKTKLTRRIPIGGEATGLTLYKGNLLVTSKNLLGELIEITPRNGKITRRLKVGQGARSPQVHSQLNVVYICNYFENSISVVELASFKEKARIPVSRMPTSLTLDAEGKYLYVSNLLPDGPANVEHSTAKVSIIDCSSNRVIKEIELANGSNALLDSVLSPDGKYIFITHSLARFLVPTTQLDRGWINTNACSIIDTEKQERLATFLLDDISQGAAGGWGLDISPDQKYLYVAHSGTHEVSVIDYAKLMEKIIHTDNKEDLEYNLSLMSEIRTRIKLPGNGPRPILAHNQELWVGQYFSDDLTNIDFSQSVNHPKITNLALTPNMTVTEERLGETIFNDATYCFQQWLSCNACHTEEARVDALNWDLLNDGIGNSKNVKSLLFAHFTPPAMISGIRADAETAVRAGVRHIQFATANDKQYNALDAYLKSLTPEPSPHLVNGKLSKAAKRGEDIFKSHKKGACIFCHNGPYLTNQKMYDMKNAGPSDRRSTWDTPTLREVWRTAPYLHDGRSATIKDVFTKENHAESADRLSKKEIDDLTEYVLSL